MALKPARDALVNGDVYAFTAIQVTAKVADPTSRQQKTNSEGVPLWTVDCLRTGKDDPAVISVTVPAKAEPNVIGPVIFEGLQVGLWLQRGREGGGLYWTAQGVNAVGRPGRPTSV